MTTANHFILNCGEFNSIQDVNILFRTGEDRRGSLLHNIFGMAGHARNLMIEDESELEISGLSPKGLTDVSHVSFGQNWYGITCDHISQRLFLIHSSCLFESQATGDSSEKPLQYTSNGCISKFGYIIGYSSTVSLCRESWLVLICVLQDGSQSWSPILLIRIKLRHHWWFTFDVSGRCCFCPQLKFWIIYISEALVC